MKENCNNDDWRETPGREGVISGGGFQGGEIERKI